LQQAAAAPQLAESSTGITEVPAVATQVPEVHAASESKGLAMPDLPALPSVSAASKPEVSAAPLMAVVETASTAAKPVHAAEAAPQSPVEMPAAAAVTSATSSPAPASTVSEVEHHAIRKSSATQTADAKAGEEKQKNSSESPGMFKGLQSVLQVAAALALVLGLVFIGKALARKFLPGARAVGSKGVIEVLARHPLTKNQSIVLVRIGSQIVALNQGKDASESVLVISEPVEVAKIIGQIEGQSPKSIQAGFNSLLANARVDLERGETDGADEPELRGMSPERLDEQLEEMAAAKRQLMELRQHVRSVRDSLPRT
jgi:flagellar biogenesis protein FliO